jgi:hypothetical protein
MSIIETYIKNKIIISYFANYIDIIINKINSTNDKFNNFFIKCNKIYKEIPPSKNENKFAFGILIQLSLIDYFNDIFNKCIDLDEIHLYGSEYKYDCRLYLTNYVYFNISIKAKSKKSGEIILINNYGKKRIHDLYNLITFVIIIETNTLYIIPHNLINEIYIKYNDANVCYKSSLLTYIEKNLNYLVVKLDKNDDFNKFMINDYNNIKTKNIYKNLYLSYI